MGANRPLRALAPGTTTLTVRNVPARYHLESLLLEWVPDGTFNLVHLPFKAEKKTSRGFAFVNCVSPEAALAFQRRWHGKFLADHGKTRALDVIGTEKQGYEAHLLHCVEMACEDDQLPATFCGTRRLNTVSEVARLVAKYGGCPRMT